MIQKPKIVTIVGTRPELIKMSLIIKELDICSNHFLVHTGQNFDFELNEIFFNDLKLRKPDFYFKSNKKTAIQTISDILIKTEALFIKLKPDALIIYGDTNSCISSYVAKKMHIPIFHLEAGNRSFDENIPEEINRKLIDHISDINMPLTERARDYLLKEGIRGDSIVKIGSCMKEVINHNSIKISKSKILKKLKLVKKKYIVVSIHREENLEDKIIFLNILNNLEYLGSYFKLPILISTHPRTQNKIDKLTNIKFKNLIFIKPLSFTDYISLQSFSFCVISDSGTIAEESSILKFPAIMLRENHERPEAFDSGVLIKSYNDLNHLINSVTTVTKTQSRVNHNIVLDYDQHTTSIIVIRCILSYISNVKKKYSK